MRGLLITAVLVLAASSASAFQASSGSPSLGELAERAKKEREARRAGKPAPRLITDADLQNHSSDGLSADPTSQASPAPGAAAPAAAGKTPKSDDELRAEKRQDIEKKIAEQQKTTEVIRKAMDDAQRELNDPTTLTMFGPRNTALQKILDDGQVELKKSEQAIADLQEEARRQGISVSRP
jgi:hypothetical protein